MIKRTIEISTPSIHLKLRHGQMVISWKGDELNTVPVEDLGLLVLDHPGISYTNGLLTALMENNTAIVFCNQRHLPGGLLLPFTDNHVHTQRLAAQTSLKAVLRKQLWKQLVVSKIKAQANLLDVSYGTHYGLKALAGKVGSGDPKNTEARAARVYWKHLFADAGFRRIPGGDSHLNPLLNYGYSILRATVARSIAGAGLHPALGIHHHNKYNPYCLADDLMEPLRPLVDAVVLRLHQELKSSQIPLVKSVKQELLKVPAAPVSVNGKQFPLMEALPMFTYSLVACYQGEASELSIPVS